MNCQYKYNNSCFGNYKYKSKYKPKLSWDATLPIPVPARTVSVFLLGITAILVYLNSIDGDFVFDDSEAIINNEDLRPETPIENLFYHDFWGTLLTSNSSHKSYRPLTVLSFRWNYWLSGGLHPWSFHLTNILLHGIVSILMLPFFSCLFGDNCPRAAFLSALIFAVHPIHAEAVAGVVGRADLLCALFFCLCFLSYCRAVRRHSLPLMLVSTLLCACSMLCKELGVTVIGLCAIWDIFMVGRLHPGSLLTAICHPCDTFASFGTWEINHRSKRGLSPSPPSSSPSSTVNGQPSISASAPPLLGRLAYLLLTGCALMHQRWKAMGLPPQFQAHDNPAAAAPLVLTRVLSYQYVYALDAWLLLCPEWLCFDWSMGCLPLVESFVDTRIFAILSMWVGIALLITKCFDPENGKTRRCVTMAGACLTLPFLPASNLLFPVGFVIAERVLYLPSAGLCMLVVVGMRQLSAMKIARKWIQFGFSFLLIVFATRAWQRSGQWRDERQLFYSGLEVCPLNAKVHYNVAKTAADAGDKDIALSEYRQALRLNPKYEQAMNNLANLLKDDGHLKEAEVLLRRAVQLRPDFAAAWMNLGIVLANLGRFTEAEISYFTALKHRRTYPDCLYNLGNLYLEQKLYNEAYKAWRNATTVKPTHTVSWSNMVIMLDNIGETNKAECVAREALAVLPKEAALHFNLGNTLGRQGRFPEAERYFTEALNLDSNNPIYHTNLGVLYHKWHKYDKAERLYLQALEINPHLQSAKDNLEMLRRKLRKIAAATSNGNES